jgi:hypothetical protein
MLKYTIEGSFILFDKIAENEKGLGISLLEKL